MSDIDPRNTARDTGTDGASMPVQSLAQFQWKNRVVLIFPDQDNAQAARQENLLLGDRSGLEQREIVILKVVGGSVRALFGAGADLDVDALATDLGSSHQHPHTGEFSTFLVGKDGTVKLATRQPISTGELFAIIDAMPMRAAEKSAAGR
jgi:hypothetical protein